MPPVSDAAIRDTVERVFEASAYNQRTQLQALVNWVAELITRLIDLLRPAFRAVRASPTLSWTLVVVGSVLLIALIARAIYAAQLRRQALASPIRFGDAWLGGGGDALAMAERAARDGNFTVAAHALYLALLEMIARQHEIRIHPSKTVGDYGRELRAKGSSLLTRYREFARSYETVIYGVGTCDRERYERLHALASPMLRGHG